MHEHELLVTGTLSRMCVNHVWVTSIIFKLGLCSLGLGSCGTSVDGDGDGVCDGVCDGDVYVGDGDGLGDGLGDGARVVAVSTVISLPAPRCMTAKRMTSATNTQHMKVLNASNNGSSTPASPTEVLMTSVTQLTHSKNTSACIVAAAPSPMGAHTCLYMTLPCVWFM